MSEPLTTAIAVPEWDLADRLGKALKHGDVKPGEMARHLGMSAATLHNWTSGKIRPKDGILRAWADRCGVPYEWLAYGTVTNPTGPGLVSQPTVTEPQTPRWNGTARGPRHDRDLVLVRFDMAAAA